MSGAGTATPDLVDPAASPAGDGPLPAAVGTVQVETATLVTTPARAAKEQIGDLRAQGDEGHAGRQGHQGGRRDGGQDHSGYDDQNRDDGWLDDQEGVGRRIGSTTSGSGGTDLGLGRLVGFGLWFWLWLGLRLGLGLGWRDGASGDAADCVVGQSAGSR